ncbi:MAG: hypothetical protein HYV26_08170 [Candidatus Hydrogenedentes bacterium]|nr:hypothetical protein [Candidatus Hydrogenedentota bacterium]
MPKTMARIGAQIATLSSETLDESTANLADISFYQWPGASLDAGSLNVQVPLVTDIEENELATILSNRRVIKVLQGLRRMNSSDREALMSTIFTEAFSRYEQLYAQEWERLEKTVAEYRSKGVVPGWMLDEGDVDHVRLPGARNEVLALCLIAGALETESAYPDILRLTQVAIDQRDAAYELSKQPGGDMAIAHLAYYSIYVRSILGTALLRTAPITYSQIEELPKKVVRLAVFDASLTPFDYPTHYGYRPDFSRGMIQIEIVYPLDDNALTAILDELNPVPIDITGLR